MEEDVKTEELETSSEESTEENQEDESKVTDESKDVPYDRFKKVIEERNRLRDEVKAKAEKEEALRETLNPTPKAQPKKEEEALTREDAILYAKGKTDEQVAYAKKVAELEGISSLEALENPLYQAWEAKQQAEDKNKGAQLGASHGSAPHVVETFKAGLSKDDHKALWNKASGN